MLGLQGTTDMGYVTSQLNKAINEVTKEIQQKADFALKKELEDFSQDLQDYLVQQYENYYNHLAESEYYNRTGDITHTIKVKLTQGGGYYGLRLWFDQSELEVVITPKGKFNKHADYEGHPITIEELLGLEEKHKNIDFVKEFQLLALNYVNDNLLKRVKVSFNKDFEADVFVHSF